MWNALRAYFTHYREERNATIIIACIILCTIAIGWLIERFTAPAPLPAALLQRLDSMAHLAKATPAGPTEVTLSPFTFNPNTLSDSGFKALGLSERHIASLRKYQAKGGTFRTRADFGKMYFMNDSLYSLLHPYIDLPEQPFAAERKEPPHWGKHRTKDSAAYAKWSNTAKTKWYAYREWRVDLNKADTTELKQLRGVGPYFAKAIVKRREQLGGYHSLEQLLEIKRMTPEIIDQLAPKIDLNPADVRKIPMNQVTTQELSSHPYVSFDLANRLVTYREQRKRIASAQELADAGLLDAELSLKLVPYLSFE